jgi:hypothetical protein
MHQAVIGFEEQQQVSVYLQCGVTEFMVSTFLKADNGRQRGTLCYWIARMYDLEPKKHRESQQHRSWGDKAESQKPKAESSVPLTALVQSLGRTLLRSLVALLWPPCRCQCLPASPFPVLCWQRHAPVTSSVNEGGLCDAINAVAEFMVIAPVTSSVNLARDRNRV